MTLVVILEIVAGVLGFVYQMELVSHCSHCSILQCHDGVLVVQGEIVAVRVTSAFDTFNAEDNDVTALVNFMQGEVNTLYRMANHFAMHSTSPFTRPAYTMGFCVLMAVASRWSITCIYGYVLGINNNVLVFVQFQCCGYDSYEDWLDTPYLNNTQLFPDSCNCTNASTVDCISVPEVPNQMIYDRNCSAGVRSFLEENLIVIGAVGITFGVLEVYPSCFKHNPTYSLCVTRH